MQRPDDNVSLAPARRARRAGADQRLAVAAGISLLLHGGIALALFHLIGRRERLEKIHHHEVLLEEQRARPKPRKQIVPFRPPPRRPKPERPRPRPRRVVHRALRVPRESHPRQPPQAPHPSERPKVIDLTARPVAGLTPDSFGGAGPVMPVGNTTLADPNAPRPRKIPRHAWSAPVPGATKDGTGFVKPRPRPRPRPVTVKVLPKPISVPRLPYPEAARRQGVEGTVKLEVTVGKDGRVLKVRVLSGVGFGLDETAVRALKKARFRPAIGSDGKPMVYKIRYRYTFRLER